MAFVELMGKQREERGKGPARRLRQAGMLPGIVYGPGGENVPVAVERRGFDRVLRRAGGGTVLIDLKLEDGREGIKVIIKEVQRDPATSEPLHVDFMHISMDKPVRVEVPVHLTGAAVGVKSEGGFLDHVLREIEIECLPTKIPDYVEVDVSHLHVGQALHASEIQLEGIEVVTPGDRVIAAVHGKRVSEVPAAGTEEAAAEEQPAEGAEASAEQEASGEAEGGGE